MISLASFSPLARWGVRLLWLVGIAGLAVLVIAAAGEPGHRASDAYECLFAALFLAPAALCLARARLVAEQHLTWTLFGAGMLCLGASALMYLVVVQADQSAPYQSISDALWLTYHAMAFAAVLALINAGLSHVRRSLWIDASVGGLALAAIAASLLVEPTLAGTGASVGAVVTTLAFPLLDALILGLLIAVFAVTRGRPGRLWTVLGLVWVGQAVVDSVYLHRVAAGHHAPGTLLDPLWPALMFLIAFAAWHKPTVASSREQSWGMLLLTIAFAVVGLVLIAYDHWYRISDAAVILSALALVAAFVRTAIMFARLRTLATGGELSMRNTLILDAVGEGIIGTDADGRVTFANPAAAHMTGYSSEELAGRDLHQTLHHTKADGTPYPVEECAMHMSLADGTIHRSDQDIYWRRDGTSFCVEYMSTPIADGPRTLGAVVVFRDISERQQAERAKDEFTSVVSHELRTPLTSIRGSLGLLESGILGPLPERGQRMIRIAVENTDRLVRLINDILDLERLDADADHLRAAPCDAANLIGRATEAMLPAALDADVTLTVSAAPAAFEGDADRIIQTLTNLISNAVKFSPAGGTVQITSERRSDEILFSVSDSGRGIPHDKLETIFGRFQQVDSSDSRQKGGTGLGLAICRSIVEHHGGRIWARSATGQGSTFSFVLPMAPEAPDEYRPRPGGELGCVLICDDNAAIREVTGTALEEHGYRVILARSGEEAIERAIAQQPDVILLDLLLPRLSGAETVAALRDHPATEEIPVVVLSVLPRSGEEVDLEAIADWIEKPAASENLFATLERAIGARDETFRVVVVERDPAVSEILAALFERHGVVTVASTGGEQTVERCEQMRADLIVLNNDLPDVDGVALKDWLRVHARLGALPIVAYDARDIQDAEHARRSVGSVAQLLTKRQTSSEEFRWRVMTLLSRPRATTVHHGDQ